MSRAQLFPDARVGSAYELPYEAFYEKGFRGIIYDIDNTLVPHGAPADDRAVALFGRLRDTGLETCLISNNKEPRVKSFAEAVGGVRYIYKAGKPGRRGYMRAMELMGTAPDTTILVGDQIFTDIWGANRLGISTVMVERIHPREEIQIILKRIPETLILAVWRVVLALRGKRQGSWIREQEHG